MPAIVKLQLSLSALAEVISSLNLEEKRQLQEIIEQQIFEDEEALYEDDAENVAEIEAIVRFRLYIPFGLACVRDNSI